jgi:hypothetical protein
VHRAFFDVRDAQGGVNDVYLVPIIVRGCRGRSKMTLKRRPKI